MRLFGLDITKSSARKKQDNRPSQGLGTQVGTASEGAIPIMDLSYEEIELIAKHSDVLGTIFDALKQETFRNGSEWEPDYTKFCLTCDKKYQGNVDKCECGGTVADPPELPEAVREKFEEGKWNKNDQDLNDLEEEWQDDLNTYDMCYVVLNKTYNYNFMKQLLGSEITEVIRGDPKTFRLVANAKWQYGKTDDGQDIMFCPVHRSKTCTTKKCPGCGKKTMRAAYVNRGTVGETKMYYSRTEVYHVKKFTKGFGYGWPQIIKVWKKTATLMYMDDMVLDWYKGRKPPRGLLLVATRSWDALQKSWNWLTNKVKKNPNMIYPLSVPSSGSKGGQIAQFIQFTNTLEEMQYTENREEMRRTIGAKWGVMPIFQADISASGGLNNEGLQVTVTTRAAITSQKPHMKIRRWLLEQYEVTDWKYQLNSPEERDEMAEIQRKEADTRVAQNMLNMGFDVNYNEEGEFEYSGEAEKPMQFRMPGMPGENPPGETDQANQGTPEKPGENNEDNQGSPAAFKKSCKTNYDDEITKMVQEEWDDVEKSEGVNIITKSTSLYDFLKASIYGMAFKGVSKSASDQIKKYLIEKTDQKISVATIAKTIMDIGKVSRNDADRIVRTEFTSDLRNKSREFAYKQRDPNDTYKYVWKGPTDNRTTTICKNIDRRAGRSGVPLKELKSIIKAEADPQTYQAKRPWSPHINCRHRLVRAVN